MRKQEKNTINSLYIFILFEKQGRLDTLTLYAYILLDEYMGVCQSQIVSI